MKVQWDSEVLKVMRKEKEFGSRSQRKKEREEQFVKLLSELGKDRRVIQKGILSRPADEGGRWRGLSDEAE